MGNNKDEFLVSVDIETDGSIPADYSILSIGATLVDNPFSQPQPDFYVELCPMTDKWDPGAMKVNGLDRDKLYHTGLSPGVAMSKFIEWLQPFVLGRQPVFLGYNAAFDWQFINWYFNHFIGSNPFSYAPLDIKAYLMGAIGMSKLADTSKSRIESCKIPKQFFPTGFEKVSHHALQDAIEQADMFRRIRTYVNMNNCFEST